MKASVYNISGEVVDQAEISDALFAVPFNEAVVHQAVARQLANSRLGTAATKTRGKVSGSTRKLYRQKHTGRAQRGDIKSPLLRGGGVVFGPHPRSYRQRMPKKMRRLALKCALSAKVRDGELMVVDQLQLEQPKTKGMVGILGALKADSSALIITPEPEANVIRSARNLQGIRISPVAFLNVVDVLSYKSLIITLAAVRKAEQIWG
jgi:large subunit ribosomal protein L4